MSNFLYFIAQVTFSQYSKDTIRAMSKRSGFHRTPRFKPEVKVVNRRVKQATMPFKKEKVDVLAEPIKSAADKKLYKQVYFQKYFSHLKVILSLL